MRRAEGTWSYWGNRIDRSVDHIRILERPVFPHTQNSGTVPDLIAGAGIGGDIAEGDGEAGSGSRCRIDSWHRACSRSSSGIGIRIRGRGVEDRFESCCSTAIHFVAGRTRHCRPRQGDGTCRSRRGYSRFRAAYSFADSIEGCDFVVIGCSCECASSRGARGGYRSWG